DRADKRAAPAGEGGAAEHRGGDAGEGVGRADRRMADAHFRGEEEAGNGGKHARQGVGAQVNEGGADAVALRRFFPEADGAEREAAARPVEPDIAGDRDGEDDEEGDRRPADAEAKDIDELLADRPERRGPAVEREALENAERRNRRDHRIELREADERSID